MNVCRSSDFIGSPARVALVMEITPSRYLTLKVVSPTVSGFGAMTSPVARLMLRDRSPSSMRRNSSVPSFGLGSSGVMSIREILSSAS